MISICITIASLGRAMQRQCDNRHHLITQVDLLGPLSISELIVVRKAIAFLARYRALRVKSGNHLVEIEYNVGRTFHQLGATWRMRHQG
jgi:general transcription factor 3C polypeptide 3 (transcription factor C subunit 4)